MNIPLNRTMVIPPLQNGDRLTRDEFERRYFAMPDVNKAELIEGEVYMPSPVKNEFHGEPHSLITCWVVTYRGHTPGLGTGDNSTVRLDWENEPQPDVLMFVKPDHGGRIAIDADGYISGMPELVVEVSASTASIDLGRKRTVYQHHQVLEYIVWRVYDDAIDWFVFRDGDYTLLKADAVGVVKSVAFPGLWLDIPAMLQQDVAKVLAVLNEGLASPEHVAFVAKQKAAFNPAAA